MERGLELHQQEEERLKTELQRKEEALKEAEEARKRAESQRTLTEKPKPAPISCVNTARQNNIR